VWAVELLLKIDKKGRITIPSEIRHKLKIKDIVKLRVMENMLIIEPIRNPLNELASLVIDSSGNIEKDIKVFREAIEEKMKELIGAEK